MLIGYSRTSTLEQIAGLEAQTRDLEAAGCAKLFSEQASSVNGRPVLDATLDFVREGDTLVVTRLDRLARSTFHLLQIVERLRTKKVDLRILDPAIDTSTATGEIMLTMLGAIATFERRLMLERQREGIAKAKREGKYRGRTPTARMKAPQVHELHAEGLKPSEVAKRLGISRRSVNRILSGL